MGRRAGIRDGISDDEVLALIVGRLLELHGGAVWKWHRWRRKMVKLNPHQHPKSGRWRYNLRLGERQRTIYRNKLVFMLAHRRIPEHTLDHEDHDNQNDAPCNLAERPHACNSADNWSRRQLDAALAFFDAVGCNAFPREEPIPW
jgi:hypothetical protein